MEKVNTVLLVVLVVLAVFATIERPSPEHTPNREYTHNVHSETEQRLGARLTRLEEQLSLIDKRLADLGAAHQNKPEAVARTGRTGDLRVDERDRTIQNQSGHMLVARHISRGVIDDKNLAELHRRLADMDAAGRNKALQELTTAINDQRLTLQPGVKP